MKLNPLVLLPGTLFWVSLIAAVTTKNEFLVGLTVVLGIGTFLGFAIVALSKSAAARKHKLRVWNEGSPATATVIRSRTNGSLNNDPYVELTLEVEGRTVAVRQLVSQIMLSRVQPGSAIAVKVDPLNPGAVVIDPALVPGGYN